MPANRFDTHMSDEDALLWHIEKDPVLRSTIVAVGLLDRPPDWARLRERFHEATALIPRLRQRVVSPPLRIGPPRWSFERDFDLDFHLHRFRLPEPATWRTLLEVVQPMAAGSFDRARPLWECTVLDGLAGGRAAVVLKVHHSVTDGVGGMELLTRLVDLERDAGHLPARPAAAPPDVEGHLGPLDVVRDSVAHTARRMLGIASRLPGVAARAALAAVRDPVGAATGTAVTARSIGRIMAPALAPMSPVMTARGLSRRLDTLDVPLDDLKRAAKRVDGSLNDAFVAAVLGGLRRYHLRHGADAEALRMTMPINLRTGSDPTAGNRFTPARFPVPAAIDDPEARMRAIRDLVRDWRAEPALALTSTLAGVLNRLPTAATTALFGGMLKCCDFTATNVPGAPIPVFVAGARVERFYAFAPPAGASLNVALISHCDTCCIGVVSDSAAVPDPDTLVACLAEGFAEIVALG